MTIETQQQLDAEYAQVFFTRLASAVVAARVHAGLSCEDVAERTGIKIAKIKRMQRGNFNGTTLEQLLDVFMACQAIPLEVNLFRKPHLQDARNHDMRYEKYIKAAGANFVEEPDGEDPDIDEFRTTA